MKNILFINPIPNNTQIILSINNHIFEEDLKIHSYEFAEMFPQIITKIIQEKNINEIWLIAGPGAFTKMRIITLTLNALAFSKKITLKSLSFFEICKSEQKPILLEANAREYIIKETNGNEYFVKKDELKTGTYTGYLQNTSDISFSFDNFAINFDNIRHLFDMTPEKTIIQPIYIKPPHITGPIQVQ